MSNEEDSLAKLISQAGARQRPSSSMEAEVRAVVHDAWQQTLRTERRQRAVWFSAAAAVILSIIGWQFNSRSTSSSSIVAATLVRASNHFSIDGHNKVPGAVPAANAVSTIYVGEAIDTGDGVALLSLEGNANLRLAPHTRVHWRTAGEIVLTSGKLYVDSGTHSVPLLIDTAFGNVSHLGTRYQVSRDEDALNVSVRDGKVAIRTPQGLTQLQAKQSFKIDSRQFVTRDEIQAYGPEWEWADNLSPGFEIDNSTLAAFLGWVAHETGHNLKYADESTRLEAMKTILHLQGTRGSLTPMTALSLVLPTTDFSVQSAEDNFLVRRL